MKITLALIIASIVALALVSVGLLSIANQGSLNFAGFAWNYETNDFKEKGCSGSVQLQGEFAVLNVRTSGSDSGCDESLITSQPINSIDELLIVYDAQLYAGNLAGATARIFITDGTKFETSRDLPRYTTLLSYSDDVSQSSRYVEPKLVKFKNNFDGTYSILTSLGVGDVLIVRETRAMPNVPLYLGIKAEAGGGFNAGSSSSTVTVYNIARKQNAFVVCKINEVLQADGTCKDLNTIILASEAAIKESFNEQIARITIELQAKNDALSIEIGQLRQQILTQQLSASQQLILNDKIAQLQKELDATKTTLNAVMANDKNAVVAVQNSEKFVQPNFIQRFFDSIQAFLTSLLTKIKGLFT